MKKKRASLEKQLKKRILFILGRSTGGILLALRPADFLRSGLDGGLVGRGAALCLLRGLGGRFGFGNELFGFEGGNAARACFWSR